jgi:hypothetical protein
MLGEETRLQDAKCRLCIPAINVTAGKNVVFKTRHHPDWERDHKLRMWRVGRATSAAPIYFPPAKIPGRGYFVDGGLWANAPIEVGIAEAVKLDYPLKEIEVLSIGTGVKTFMRRGETGWFARDGALGWGTDLVQLIFEAQSQRSTNLAGYLLDDEQIRHVDFALPDDVGGLDAADEASLLAERAQNKAKNTGKRIREQFFDTTVRPFKPYASDGASPSA